MQLKELVEVMARALVDDPDSVEVQEIEGARSLMIEIRVSLDDLGRIIGREGRNVAALRMITSAAAAKLKKRAVLEIIESR